VLCNIDKEKQKIHQCIWWFNVCRTGLEIYEERLNFDEVVTEDKTA
jgi:hypothetical protein